MRCAPDKAVLKQNLLLLLRLCWRDAIERGERVAVCRKRCGVGQGVCAHV